MFKSKLGAIVVFVVLGAIANKNDLLSNKKFYAFLVMDSAESQSNNIN